MRTLSGLVADRPAIKCGAGRDDDGRAVWANGLPRRDRARGAVVRHQPSNGRGQFRSRQTPPVTPAPPGLAGTAAERRRYPPDPHRIGAALPSLGPTWELRRWAASVGKVVALPPGPGNRCRAVGLRSPQRRCAGTSRDPQCRRERPRRSAPGGVGGDRPRPAPSLRPAGPVQRGTGWRAPTRLSPTSSAGGDG